MRLYAELDELNEEEYSWQWQVAYELEQWEDVEGATTVEAQMPYTPECDTALFRLKAEKVETQTVMEYAPILKAAAPMMAASPMLKAAAPMMAAVVDTPLTESQPEDASNEGIMMASAPMLTSANEAEEDTPNAGIMMANALELPSEEPVMLLSAPVMLLAAGDSTTIWKKVQGTWDISANDTYIIVSDNGYMLTYDTGASVLGRPIEFEAMEGYDNYYTTSIPVNDTSKWKISGSYTVRNVGNSSYYMLPNNGSIFTTSSTSATGALTNGKWKFSYTTGSWPRRTTYYLRETDGVFSSAASDSSNSMTIYYKLEEEPVEPTYWKKATSKEELGFDTQYMIVYDDQALTYSPSSTAGSTVNMQPRNNGHHYMTEDAVNDNQWEIKASGSDYTISNNGTHYLQMGDSALFGGAQTMTLTPNSDNGTWLVKRSDENYWLQDRNNTFGRVDNTAATGTSMTIYYKLDKEPGEEEWDKPGGGDVSAPHNKYIDYLGDDMINPDTEVSGANDYRLYLDMSGKTTPIDMLLIVDRSSSMSSVLGGSGQARDALLVDYLNGSSGQKGFIEEFYSMNPENEMAIVWFGGHTNNNTDSAYYDQDSGVAVDWKDEPFTVSLNGTNAIGSRSGSNRNYMAAYFRALQTLDDKQNNGKTKYVIFLSTGDPTCYVTQTTGSGTRPYAPYETFKSGTTLYRYNSNNMSNTNDATEQDFKPELSSEKYPEGVRIYAVAYGMSPNSVMSTMVTSDSGGKIITIEDDDEKTDDLTKLDVELHSILCPQNVCITDQLSNHVVYNAQQADLRVQMSNADTGESVVLYQNGALTPAANGILQSVSYASGTRMVTAQFAQDYCMSPDYRYIVSFNVEVAQATMEDFRANGVYPDVGDASTDRTGNITSSDQPGYFANTGASVSYKISGLSKTDNDYQRPVVQVLLPPVDPDAPTPVEKAPDHFKRIDAFRDGTANPDTTLDDTATDKTDLYRLYLDVGPEEAYEAADVLFILDRSSTMSDNDAKDILGTENAIRRAALNDLMNGQQTPGENNIRTLYANGMISKIAGLNADSRIAVGGYTARAVDIYGWTKGGTFVGDNTSADGSNYIAGLQKAVDLLSDPAIAGDGRRKIMIFMSDGNPTEYYEGLDDRTSQPIDARYSSQAREKLAQYTGEAIDEFKSDYPDLTIYTVGIGSFDTKYLDRLSTDGSTIKTVNFRRLSEILEGVITGGYGYYDGLKIVDQLSSYVVFHTQDDLLVELVNDATQEKQPLYKNGALTTLGGQYIKSNGVTLNRNTNTVTVEFKDDYRLPAGILSARPSMCVPYRRHTTITPQIRDSTSA